LLKEIFMNILITGGAGFLGQQLVAKLLTKGTLDVGFGQQMIDSITCFDQMAGVINHPKVRNIAGNIADQTEVAGLIAEDTQAVVHLAAVVSGTAEANFDLGMRVNVDGTRYVLEACRAMSAKTGKPPRLLFSSSIAVFGGTLPAVIVDSTAATPQGSYGVQKLIGEQLVQDYSRKGFIDGRALRVPTVVVRPGEPNGAASGFASGIIREPMNGKEAILPVDPKTKMWIASPRAVVGMFIHALETPADAWGWHRVLNLPGLVASMEEELAALRLVGGDAALALVKYQPDEKIVKLVDTWATNFDTARARSMGFTTDIDFESIVRAYVADNRLSA
jgi:D-erythronate 2-dehydrogenase